MCYILYLVITLTTKMDYITNSKNRKLKNKIHFFFSRLSFNFLHFSGSLHVINIGVFISFLSLFLNWFSIVDNTLSGGAFSIHAGYIGYIIILINCIILFLVLSNTQKEKIKTKAHMNFSDHNIIITS